ncbi:restriction endonuclease subunit S domain-containing protein [Flaviaesturariibacter terrae]
MNKKGNLELVPTLRFPKFLEKWKEISLSDILSEGRLGGNFATTTNSKGIPIIKMGNIERGNINYDKLEYLQEDTPYSPLDILNEGDLLFNTRNTLELVGKVAIWKNELPLALYNSNLMRLTFTKSSVASNYFMNCLLNTAPSIKKLREIATGTTSVAAIYTKDLLKLNVVIPGDEEQQKIASCLSSLDELITAETQNLEALKAHKKGLMQQLFPAEGETVPRLRFAGFEGEWEETTLGEISKFSSGGTPSKDNPEYWNGSIPWISAASMHNYSLDDSELKITDLAVSKGAAIANEGQLLILVRGSMLYKRIPMGIAKCTLSFNQDVKALTLEARVNSQYLLYYLVASEPLLLEKVTATGIGAGKLDSNDLKQFEILIPPLEEQYRIVEAISALDEMISAQTERLESLNVHKKGLMQGLFPSVSE